MDDLSPDEVAALLAADRIVLVDVREENEYAAGHIAGACLKPLSCFDPAALPRAGTREIVFQCGSGMRSAKALAAARAAGVPVLGHMAGGLQAWRAAGLDVTQD